MRGAAAAVVGCAGPAEGAAPTAGSAPVGLEPEGAGVEAFSVGMKGGGGAVAPGADEPLAGVFGDGEATGEAAAEGEAEVDAGVEADVAGAAGVCASAAAIRKGAQATALASKTRILINRNLRAARWRAPLDTPAAAFHLSTEGY